MNSISCLFAFVGIALIIFGIWWAFAPKKSRVLNIDSTAAKNDKQTKLSSWTWPIIIAIALAFWSVVFALFFLSIIWVMQLNPDTDSKEISFPSDKDRKRAKGTYTWLLLSPVLNIIILVAAVFNLSSSSSSNERVIAALIPLLFHLPVLIKLDFKSPFVFRHTQQAILLLALRASMAALAVNISKYPDEGIWLFFVGNGFLWLFGSLWGRGQANTGKGWWINRKGETVIAPNTIPTKTSITNDEFEDLLKSLDAKGNTALQKALNAFRKGTPETRKKAVIALSQLGEVEKF